ncbi:hypothetical protein Hanom_Chr03g00194491 [Helianthus anomalus]
MMLGRMSRKARPVVREKSGEDTPLWRMFCSDFKGKVAVLPSEDGVEGFDFTMRDNFRLPEWEAMEAVMPQGKGGKISRIRLRKYIDYVVVSDTLERLGVPGGGAAAGGSSTGSKLADDNKRKGDASAAGGQKGPKLRRTRTAAIPHPKPTVITVKLTICLHKCCYPSL